MVQPLKEPVSKPPFVMPPPEAEVIVSDTVVEWVALAPVPVTVRVYVPAAAVPVFTVSVDEPPDVIGLVLKPAVAPLGTPLTLRLTLCADPLVTAVLIVEVPLPPCARDRLLGLALIEKSFVTGAVTVREIDVV